jgi:hypothetical protein
MAAINIYITDCSNEHLILVRCINFNFDWHLDCQADPAVENRRQGKLRQFLFHT